MQIGVVFWGEREGRAQLEVGGAMPRGGLGGAGGTWRGIRARDLRVGQSFGDLRVLLTISSVKVNIQGQKKAALTRTYI